MFEESLSPVVVVELPINTCRSKAPPIYTKLLHVAQSAAPQGTAPPKHCCDVMLKSESLKQYEVLTETGKFQGVLVHFNFDIYSTAFFITTEYDIVT